MEFSILEFIAHGLNTNTMYMILYLRYVQPKLHHPAYKQLIPPQPKNKNVQDNCIPHNIISTKSIFKSTENYLEKKHFIRLACLTVVDRKFSDTIISFQVIHHYPASSNFILISQN